MMSFSDGKTVTAMLPASTVGDNLKLFFLILTKNIGLGNVYRIEMKIERYILVMFSGNI